MLSARHKAFATSNYWQVAAPMYIRDCMDGLIENKDKEHMEIYLNSITELVEADAFTAREVRDWK